jgi:hypothetical protein
MIPQFVHDQAGRCVSVMGCVTPEEQGRSCSSEESQRSWKNRRRVGFQCLQRLDGGGRY